MIKSHCRCQKIRLFLFLLCHCAVSSIYCQCTRNSTDTRSNVTFICSYQANITRQFGCLTRVAETIALPHSTGNPWIRTVPYLSGQNIDPTSISVRTEGRSTKFTFSHDSQISIPMNQIDQPVSVELGYALVHGVMSYTGHCHFTNDGAVDDSKGIDEGKFSVMYWSLGQWNITVDQVFVTFKTYNGTSQ